MSDLRLHLAHHVSDAQAADQLKNHLESAIGAQGIDPADTPSIELNPSLEICRTSPLFGRSRS